MDSNTLTAARNAMAAWEKGNTRPFAMVNSVHAYDRSQGILGEASAMLSMLSAACFDADAVGQADQTSEFQSVNPHLLASALSGIGTLVDLANFLLED